MSPRASLPRACKKQTEPLDLECCVCLQTGPKKDMKRIPKTPRLLEKIIEKMGEMFREFLINRKDGYMCRRHLKRQSLDMSRVREEVYEEPERQHEEEGEAGAGAEPEHEEDLVPLIPNIKREPPEHDFSGFEIASGSRFNETLMPNYPEAEIPPNFNPPFYSQFQDERFLGYLNVVQNSREFAELRMESSSSFEFPALQNNVSDPNRQT